jgi:hypothetical protein
MNHDDITAAGKAGESLFVNATSLHLRVAHDDGERKAIDGLIGRRVCV